ncbi:hypothetical protein D0T84_19940 [Dysgonomonas sp. 521]|uniref:DUF6493 family protein n=1 Tax=Dysgonomonas sp. 521 TaxID=2302932 RepID=UPI0013D0445A|nr:DUF6493 family protein [Dysgonomonas sp. 521]NDV97155.1 hypothetical protein [Dysgonomonas sp. 521]
MAIIEEFKIIYYNNQTNKVIPFLQRLTAKERKELARDMKPLTEEKKKHNRNIFFAAALACCTKTQYRIYTEWMSGRLTELVDEVLAWQCPAWLSEHYNKQAERDWYLIDYHNVLNWQLKGYLSPSPMLIARSLASSFCGWNPDTNSMVYEPEVLEIAPITLDEHIWTLFQVETSIYYRDNYFASEDKDNTEIWKKVLKGYADSGRIDRIRVLKECLLTVNFDFKRDMAGWFADLFVYMQPSLDELLQIQDELFIAFMSKYPKMINKSLDEIKKIASHKDFSIDDFILRLPLLLSSETKSIVVSSLMILEKTSEAHADKRDLICSELTPVFLNKDEAVQTRAAKIIVKYGNTDSDNLKSAVQAYSDSILMSVKPLLEAYMTIEATVIVPDEVDTQQILNALDENNCIPSVETFDDLIFFLPKAFNDKEPYYRDLLLPTLIKLNHLVTETNIEQLEVALRKAYEVTLHQPFWHSFHHKTNEFETSSFWGEGLSYHWATLFFINYCQYLAKKYPAASAFITDMHREAVDADKKRTFRSQYLKYYRQVLPQKDWAGKEYKVFRPYYHITQVALSYIEKGITLPLLSTPTHSPTWIDPAILIERILQYQSASTIPDKADLDVALSRCPEGHIDELVDMAGKSLDEEYKELVISYFSDRKAEQKKKSFLSLLAKEETPYNRKALIEHYNCYSWQIGDEKKKDSTWTERPVIDFNIPASPWEKEDNLYSGTGDNIRYCIGPSDVRQFVFLYPALAALPYAQIIKDRFEFAQIPNAETRDFLQEAVAALYELKIGLGSVTSLFLACCMLCSEKNIRNYSAEIWLERTSSGLIDNEEFGRVIGKLEKGEWAPLKRLTDLISDNLLGVSGIHNKGLEQMIVAVLSQIDKPVANTKKLLEIYNELLALNNSTCNVSAIPQLKDWSMESSLKKIVKQITEKI